MSYTIEGSGFQTASNNTNKESIAVEIVSKTLPYTARVQKGLELVQEGRFQEKPIWGKGLTVLDEETAKLPLVKRKDLAIKKVLS